MSDELRELVGKRIVRITVAPDGQYIAFDPDFGSPIVFYAAGDCCSRSWVEAVSNAANILGEVVTSTEELQLPDPDPQPEKYDVLAVYGHAIHTAKGSCQIEYRNDSNGYYGGSLERIPEPSPKTFADLSCVVADDWTCNDAERKYGE